jgi:WD40 repeat protein
MGMLLLKNLLGRPWFDTFFAGAKNTHHERKTGPVCVKPARPECGAKRRVSKGAGLVFLLLTTTTFLNATTYGSDSACTVPSRAFFPSSNTNNSMEGFASFDSGFFLEDYLCTTTFDDFYPVRGDVGLTNGQLWLDQDLVLGNTTTILTAGGTIVGNNHAVKILSTTGNITIPTWSTANATLGSFSIAQLSANTITSSVNSVDWNYNGQYVMAVASNAGLATANRIQLYYFNGLTRTTTTMESTGNRLKNFFCARWFPTNKNFAINNYCAVGSAYGAGTNNIDIYYKNATGPLRDSSGFDTTNATYNAVAWHTSGLYLVAGSNLSPQLNSYSFNPTTGAINATAVSTATPGTVSINAISFAPGGNYLAVGTATSPYIYIYPFTGAGAIGTAATAPSTTPGATVESVDWCPTGTYIAVGTTAQANSLQMYTFLNGTTTQIATFPEPQQVNGLQWDPTGNLLAVCCASGTGPVYRIFYFDKVKLRFVEYYRNGAVTATQGAIRWARSGNFIARGDYGSSTNAPRVWTHGITRPPLTLKNATLALGTDTTLQIPVSIIGNCKITSRGKRLSFQNSANIVVRPGGSLVIEDCTLQTVGNSNIRCLTNLGNITLSNCKMELANNYTFSQGMLFFDRDVLVTGTNAFIYSSGLTSSILSGATLVLAPQTSFQYAPNAARTNLLQFVDPTSVLYLNGCSLSSTRTALLLTGGTVIFDDLVTLSSGALYPAEAMTLAATMTINVWGNANVAMYGYIRTI